MLKPFKTGQSDVDYYMKLDTVLPWMAFFWLSRVRRICVKFWKCLIGVSVGRR